MTIAMQRVLAILTASLLGGCVSTPPPPGRQIAQATLEQAVIPGQTTKANLLATLGPTQHMVFDSGFEAWLYQASGAHGRLAEFVVLIDPAGVVSKTRLRVVPTEIK